jgi:hypothetical protein
MSSAPIQIGSKLSENVACTECKQMIPVPDAHCFKGKKGEDLYYCSACKLKLDAAFAVETESPNLKGAICLGLIAGITAGAIWSAIQIFTGYQVGYVALGAGYLIGYAVVWGSGKKRGTSLQSISAVITLLSVAGASYFSLLHSVNKYLTDELAKEGKSLPSFVWVSPFQPEVLSEMISPMTLLIWGIGIYIAFRVPQARKLK